MLLGIKRNLQLFFFLPHSVPPIKDIIPFMSRTGRPKVINSHILQPCSSSSDRRQGSSCNSAGVIPTCVTVIAPPFSLLIGGGDGTGANRIRPVIALPEKKGGGIENRPGRTHYYGDAFASIT